MRRHPAVGARRVGAGCKPALAGLVSGPGCPVLALVGAATGWRPATWLPNPKTGVVRLLHRLRALAWRVARPTTLGSRCLVLSGEAVLLVRHTYEPWWYLPGGGVGRGESFADAARREVREETGLRVAELRLFGLYHSRAEGKSDHIALFVAGAVAGTPRAASREIAAVTFAPLDALPPETSPATRRRIAEWRGDPPAERW